MSISVSNSLYSYATGTADINATREIQESATLAEIHSDYVELFDKYGLMHGTLLGQLNEIFGTKYSDTLDIETIFSDVFSEKYKSECKEGIKAYKYYLKEVVMGLNNLWSWKKQAETLLGQLNDLTGSNQNENGDAHYIITQLEIADKHIQDIIKTFTEYVVRKEVTQYCYVSYNDGTGDKEEISLPETFSVCETEYMDISSKYTSKIGEKIKNIDVLKGLKAQKQKVERTLNISYKDSETGDLTDKYDNLAYYDVKKSDTITSTSEDRIALFDELPLLDKLKYIKIYYDDTSGSRYIFPKDKNFGYPCVKPEYEYSPTEDNNEIGQLEMFYIGYLVDRDGPVNAVASFMEVKSTAIKEQIVLMSYRVKALQYYIKLLNRGLEELTKSQSSGPDEIPEASKNILQYLGPNITRSLMYLKDANGTFLKDSKGNELKNPYLVVQYKGDDPAEADKEDKKAKDAGNEEKGNHLSNSRNYILIEATDEGIENFLKPNSLGKFFEEASSDTCILGNYKIDDNVFFIVGSIIKIIGGKNEGTIYSVKLPNLFLRFKSSESHKLYLPKELGVSRLDISNITVDNYAGSKWGWNKAPEELDDTWTGFIESWTSTYDTTISNYKSQLEYVEKTITSLRKKIDTFDSMASSSRSKAYSIYNKTVNKIG